MNVLNSLLHFILTNQSELLSFKNGFLNKYYPVGTVYMTVNANFNPQTAWGGTWVLETEGYAVMAGSQSGSYRVGTNYGARTKSYTPAGSVTTTVPSHNTTGSTLTGAQSGLKQHAHNIDIYAGSGSTTAGYAAWSAYQGGGRYSALNTGPSNAASAHSHGVNAVTASSSFRGTAANIDVMQQSKPYYIWRRTA